MNRVYFHTSQREKLSNINNTLINNRDLFYFTCLHITDSKNWSYTECWINTGCIPKTRLTEEGLTDSAVKLIMNGRSD